MRTIVSISADLQSAKRDVLARIYSEGQRREYGFEVCLLQDDPRVPQILRALEEVGYRQWSGRGDRNFAAEYRFTLIREYEPSDFEHVEYVEFWPELVDGVHAEGRDEQGFLRLERPTLKKAKHAGLDFAHATHGQVIIVLQPVRDVLSAQDFHHLMFRPTTLVTGRGTRPGRYTPIPWEQFKVTQPWWELTSDLRMPPLAPSVNLLNHKNEPFRPGDGQTPCWPKEDSYNHAELHYRRSDLAATEPFDAALTFENFGSTHSERRSTIVSKRFYDFCRKKGLKGRWAPVRIDPR